MGADRAELIRAFVERFNAGDREIRPDEVDPEGEVHSALTGQVYRGYDGLQVWMREIDEQFDTWHLALEDLSELPGDRMLVLGAVHAKGRGSGIELDTPVGWIFEFREDRFLRVEIFLSHDDARQAAGAP